MNHSDVHLQIENIIGVARAAGVFIGAGQSADVEFAQLQFGRGVQWLQAGDPRASTSLPLQCN